MLALQTLPNSISFIPDETALHLLTDRAEPEPTAAGLHPLFAIAPAPIISDWSGEPTLPTQTERRQDKESGQFPEDEVGEPLFTRMPCSETPDAELADAVTWDAPTQTGRRQDKKSRRLPAREVAESAVAPRTCGDTRDALAAPVETTPSTQTGRRQDQKIPSVLTDAVKAFIVRRLAHYETPTHVAAAVRLEFGIAITRRQVFAYDPAGSRKPARRWIDLHAATRAKFLRDVAEIGVAQQVVRLQMLDRFARDADDEFDTDRAAKFLVLAAKECGGFYLRTPRPKAAATPSH